jgi:PAS domain S-box-containing protein
MTRNADFKRRVRDRMARTGESYAAARPSGSWRSAPATNPSPTLGSAHREAQLTGGASSGTCERPTSWSQMSHIRTARPAVRIRRWLGRHVWVFVSSIAIVSVMFANGWLVLAVAAQKDRLREAQVAVAGAEVSAVSPRRSPLGLLHGERATPYEFTLNEGLRKELSTKVAELTAAWDTPTARAIAADTTAQNAAVGHLMELIRQRRIPAAQRYDDAVVERIGGRLTDRLTHADAQLKRELRTVDDSVRKGALAVVAAAALLLLIVMLLSAGARRRRERAETEERMARDNSLRLQALLQNSSDMISVVAPDTTVIYQAGSVASVLGHEPAQFEGRPLTDWVEPEDAMRLAALCAMPNAASQELRMRHRDGTVRACEVRATKLPADAIWSGVVLNIRDVGERKALETELALAQRLESVGQLAAGIAHEINTPLQFVSTTTVFVRDAISDLMALLAVDAELRDAAERGTVSPELLTRVRDAAERADLDYLLERLPGALERIAEGTASVAKIVAAMRTFALPPTLERQPVDINEAIRNTLVVTASEHRDTVDVTTDFGELPQPNSDLGEINQVLLNLIVNASHAIADAVGDSGARGTLHIRTSFEDDNVLISIADTGTGIPDDIAHRVFEQFFTTKEVGRGTGQGLAIARRLVVERHGGALSFDTRPGEGTTFHVRLPLHEPALVA